MTPPPAPSGRPDHDADLEACLTPVLDAFASGDAHHAATALLAAADPRLASKLGGVDHLVHLLANPAWAPLRGHRGAFVGASERIGATARTTVRVETSDGTWVAYLASLRRVEDERGEAWRITGLVREELSGE